MFSHPLAENSLNINILVKKNQIISIRMNVELLYNVHEQPLVVFARTVQHIVLKP